MKKIIIYEGVIRRRRFTRKINSNMGASFNKNRGYWLSRIKFAGKDYFLGNFETKEEASKLAERASKMIDKEYSLFKTLILSKLGDMKVIKQ